MPNKTSEFTRNRGRFGLVSNMRACHDGSGTTFMFLDGSNANHITFSYSKYQPHRRVFADRSSSFRAANVIEYLSLGAGNRFWLLHKNRKRRNVNRRKLLGKLRGIAIVGYRRGNREFRDPQKSSQKSSDGNSRTFPTIFPASNVAASFAARESRSAFVATRCGNARDSYIRKMSDPCNARCERNAPPQ